jgi:hypothetical protein
LNNWKDCPIHGRKKKEPEPLLKIWKRRSVFWDLPYWPILDTPHSLDIMNITKNVCESLLATLFDKPDKTEDGPKERQDLKTMGIREDLHVQPKPKEIDKGKQAITSKRDHYCNPSCFTLSKKELDQTFNCLDGIKVSS